MKSYCDIGHVLVAGCLVRSDVRRYARVYSVGLQISPSPSIQVILQLHKQMYIAEAHQEGLDILVPVLRATSPDLDVQCILCGVG